MSQVVVVGCSGVGKKNLSRELMKHMADGPPVDYEEPVIDFAGSCRLCVTLHGGDRVWTKLQ